MSYTKSIGTIATFTAILLAAGVALGSGASNTITKHNADAQRIGDGNNTG